ncbi:MAG: FkbM family methyltransferase [Sphingobacteriaceae bacterium]|nr:FkbM family methyltransferase [Sphingobacteriaceae bacterium]
MKQFLYRLIYSDLINPILTGLVKHLFPFLPKSFKIPPSGKIKINLSNGKILYLKTNQTNFGTSLIYWNGYKNFEYTPIFEKLAATSNCFYDIGANIGYFSLLASKINPKIKIKSFEPALGPLHYLQENIQLNNLNNIKVESIALSNQVGSIDFYEVKSYKYTYLKYNLAGEGNAGSKTDSRMFVKNSVKCVTADDYLKQNPEDKVDLVKMDTEGTEHFILQKSDILLSKFKPIIICETLFNEIEGKLEDILLPYGYEFYNHVNDGLVPVKTLRREKDNGVRNCFFVHPSKKELIQEFIIPN